MVYSTDVPRTLAFYRDLLGFRVIEEMEGHARIRAPKGSSTIRLHTIHGEEGESWQEAPKPSMSIPARSPSRAEPKIRKLPPRENDIILTSPAVTAFTTDPLFRSTTAALPSAPR
jgi:catechol 2,3-dioxygenase-like lactoylglutathione lyase family enzyme